MYTSPLTHDRVRRGAGVIAFVALLVAAPSMAARAQAADPSASSPSSTSASSDASSAPAPAAAQPAATEDKPTLEIYGFGQADAIDDFKQNDPAWYDVNRPSRLPSSPNQFGQDGHFYVSARQSRFGAKGELPTEYGPVKAVFEFDMFGVGVDAGQTTIRLRHAYGQWRWIGAGLTNSQFMDVDVFPNILDYWGPNGMLFFRNVQVFAQLHDSDHLKATVAIEQPGASGDQGVYANRIELQGIVPRFPAPDVSGHVRMIRGKSHLQIGGMLRRINYDDTTATPQLNLSGHVTGWGVSFSSVVQADASNALRLQYVYGQGVENYFNDAPIDVGIQNNFGNPVTPVVGKALPDHGLVAYLDHKWNEKLSSSVGYSMVRIVNSDAQTASAYRRGDYASANLLVTPVKNVMMGGEFQWARRENNSDGFKVNDYRLQFSFKYSFSYKVGG